MTAKVGAIDLGDHIDAAELVRCDALGHRLPELVLQTEGCFILDVQVAAQFKRGLAFRAVDEHHGGRKVVPDRKLVVGEAGAAGEAEVFQAFLTAPARRTIGPPTVVAAVAVALWADRLSVGLRPADHCEYCFRLGVGHLHDPGQVDRARVGGEKEVLLHGDHVIRRR